MLILGEGLNFALKCICNYLTRELDELDKLTMVHNHFRGLNNLIQRERGIGRIALLVLLHII